jgi:hypothetical protein
MNKAAAERIAKAVLYEGYMLYPYRPSAIKNKQRFNFGVIYPQAFSDVQRGTDPWTMHTECLVEGSSAAKLEVQVRFLQLVERSVEETMEPGLEASAAPEFHPVPSLTIDGQTSHTWQEAVERTFNVAPTDLETLNRYALQRPIHLPSNRNDEDRRDARGVLRGRVVRSQYSIDGFVEVRARRMADRFFKIEVTIRNTTHLEDPSHVSRDHALARSLVSAHIVLGVEGGEFVSLLDPPESLRPIASDCHNQGTFPVLVGDEGQRDTVLASPIILYDYPQIAPESAGDLFDGTEIDEILSLRIMTMTDEEKREMRESDERARQMLERTETMPAEQFMKLHGALRGLRPSKEEF